MATALREIFLALGIDTKAAVQGLHEADKAVDASKKNLKELDERNEKLKQGFKDFGSKVASGAKIAAVALTAATTATALFFDRWSKGAQEIERTSKSYGIGTDALQELRFAAEKLGGEGESITEVFKEMAIRITEVAETGTGPATDALTLLKLKAEDLKKLRPEQQFEVLADAIAKVGDEGTRFFIKDSLFGEEGGIKIGNLLEQGSAGIAKFREEARSLGVVLDKDAIKQANELRGSFFTLHKTGEGLVNLVATRLSPKIKDIADRFLAWAKANKDVIATRVEKTISMLVDGISKLAPLLGDTLDAFNNLVTSVGGLDNALYGSAAAWAAWQLAALTAIGPVGAAIAALTTGLAVGAGLAKYAQSFQVELQNLRTSETQQFNSAASLLESPSSGLPGEAEARARLEQELINFGLLTQLDKGKLRSAQLQADIDAQLAEIGKAALGFGEFTDLEPTNITTTDSPASMRLGKIAKPGDKAPESRVTAKSLLLEKQKRAREEQDLRNAIDELDRVRPGSEGGARQLIESAKAEALQRLSNTSDLSINQLIASAVGQDTGFGGAQLRPAGLGTTINNIDASVTFNMGGIEVAASLAGSVSGNAQAAGSTIGESVASVLQGVLNTAFQAQRGQIIG
jgi:hypothetical protein